MKETKIEKLILDLSNRWDCSPQEAVDRLNSMNESEINKLINSMTKKFQTGGIAERPYVNYTDQQLDSIGRVWSKGLRETEGNLDNVLKMRDNWLSEKVARDKKKAEEEKTQKLQEEAAKWNSHLYKLWTNSQSNAQIQMPASLYKNGGFIDCLRAGGKTYAECKKCGGKTPVQNAGLGDILGRIFGTNEPVQTREPGTRPSSAGVFQPDYVKRDDALWFNNNGARVRNHFVGNKLTQAFTTPDSYGNPILQYRIIENYDNPMPGDTSYVNGYGSRNVSEEYKRAANKRLQGAEPEARSANEVRAINKSNKTGVSAKKCGGPLPKKNKFKK